MRISPDTIAYEHLIYEVDEEKVCWLTLNRPEKLNAMNSLLIGELQAGLLRADADDEVNVIVIRGAGKAFCAGFDLVEDATDEWASIYDYRNHYLEQYEDFITPWKVTKPTIASIHKYAIGKGFELSLFADVTITTSDVRMGYGEVRHGIAAHCMILPWVVPMKAAKELLLTGREVSAAEAKQLGLVTQVVEPDELADATRRTATLMARIPREMQRLHKTYLNRVYDQQGLQAAAALYIELSAMIGMEPESVQQEFRRLTLAEGLRASLDFSNARYEQI